jgi:hypothetical protein
VSLLVDALVVAHLAFTAFVVLGGLLVLRWPHIAWLHVPAAAWGAWIEVAGWICPLTPLENLLRAEAGQTGYETSFVEHYLLPVLYPAGLTREVQWLLAAVVMAVNGGIYTLALRRRHRRGSAGHASSARNLPQ